MYDVHVPSCHGNTHIVDLLVSGLYVTMAITTLSTLHVGRQSALKAKYITGTAKLAAPTKDLSISNELYNLELAFGWEGTLLRNVVIGVRRLPLSGTVLAWHAMKTALCPTLPNIAKVCVNVYIHMYVQHSLWLKCTYIHTAASFPNLHQITKETSV